MRSLACRRNLPAGRRGAQHAGRAPPLGRSGGRRCGGMQFVAFPSGSRGLSGRHLPFRRPVPRRTATSTTLDCLLLDHHMPQVTGLELLRGCARGAATAGGADDRLAIAATDPAGTGTRCLRGAGKAAGRASAVRLRRSMPRRLRPPAAREIGFPPPAARVKLGHGNRGGREARRRRRRIGHAALDPRNRPGRHGGDRPARHHPAVQQGSGAPVRLARRQTCAARTSGC